jgi:hypothetical protein
MSFGKWRGAPLACVLTAVLGWMTVEVTQAGDFFHHSIPREVEAVDVTTGGPNYAPPIPYGHYAKDHPLAHVGKAIGCVSCKLHGLCGLGGCGKNHHCGDGKCGHGLGGHGGGCGHGEGAGCGQGGHGAGCGHGLFGHGHGHGQGGAVGATSFVDPSFGHGHHGAGQVIATGQGVPQATGQVIASPQDPCGVGGCGLKGMHSHLGNALGKMRCGLCKGKGAGCGLCGGLGMADPCAGCGGRGCDGCGGLGCHGLGKGCGGLCGKFAGLGAKAHGKLAGLFAHRQKIDYFVGPGGPVPITPGYVPYIISTRSPRDFFSFAPMNPNDPYP